MNLEIWRLRIPEPEPLISILKYPIATPNYWLNQYEFYVYQICEWR